MNLPAPKIVVADSCLLITLGKGGLVGRLLTLGCDIRIVDAMAREEMRKLLATHRSLRHTRESLSSAEMEEAMRLEEAQPRISLLDASAFVLARRLGTPLLTRDGPLGRHAAADGVTWLDLAWCMDAFAADTERLPSLVRGLRRIIQAGETGPDIDVLPEMIERCEVAIADWSSPRRRRARPERWQEFRNLHGQTS